jgi:hypothetical protein
VGFNFLTADRDQSFLLPPDVREWLPTDHLAWFIIDVVDQLDLEEFRRVYRADGHGRPAYDPEYRKLQAPLQLDGALPFGGSVRGEQLGLWSVASRLASDRPAGPASVSRLPVRR